MRSRSKSLLRYRCNSFLNSQANVRLWIVCNKDYVKCPRINGAAALLEGFGDSPPSQEVAQSRANACLHGEEGNPCRFNHRGGFSLTALASSIIHAQRQKKLELNLRVEGEENLGVCRVCSCYMPLKVWLSTKILFDHTDDSAIQRFPDWCQIKKELLQCQKPQ